MADYCIQTYESVQWVWTQLDIDAYILFFFIPFEKYFKMCEIVLMYWKFNCSF